MVETINHETEIPGIKVKVRSEKAITSCVELSSEKPSTFADQHLYHQYKTNPNVYYYLPRNNQTSVQEKVVTTDLSLLQNNMNSVYTNVPNHASVRQMEKLGAKTVGLC